MSAPQIPADILAQFRAVNEKNYQDQAIFYLNAFWVEGADAQAEEVWQLVQAFIKEDHVKGKDGNELNPIQAFNLLQKHNKTLTALELKALLRKVDYDANGEMSLAEYLVGFNNRDPIKFIKNPQGEVDKVKMQELENKMNALDEEFKQLQAKEAASKAAEAEAKATQAVADAHAAEAKAAEDEVRKVEDEARAVAAEIKHQEDAKAAEIARLEALSTDQSVGIVKRNMAVQQLAAAKNEDPLPLRKAKLSQDAVVRRLEKVTKAAEAVTAKAQAAADVAKAAADEAARAVQAVEDQIKVVQDAIKEVEAELEILRNSPASPMGALFWQQRTLEERKKSLPQRMW